MTVCVCLTLYDSCYSYRLQYEDKLTEFPSCALYIVRSSLPLIYLPRVSTKLSWGNVSCGLTMTSLTNSLLAHRKFSFIVWINKHSLHRLTASHMLQWQLSISSTVGRWQKIPINGRMHQLTIIRQSIGHTHYGMPLETHYRMPLHFKRLSTQKKNVNC